MNPLPHPRPSSPPTRPGPFGRHRTVYKLLTVATLVLLGLVPLSLIRGVLVERRQRHQEALDNITTTWGNPQVIAGPILVVPYQRHVKTWKEQIVNGRSERFETTDTLVARAHFLPAELDITGQLEPEQLHRGIYETTVYRASLKLSGHFTPPGFTDWKVAPEDILWDDALVWVAISDLRGASEMLTLRWGGRALALQPGAPSGTWGPTLQARVPGLPMTGETTAFELALKLNGSRSLQFAPFGMHNRVRLTSTFPDPSFHGAFLPAHRQVSAGGFEADWQVSYYGRGYPQQWSDADRDLLRNDVFSASLFGVGMEPVMNSYRYVERAIKYGVLFLALVFTAFFVFEVRSLARVHPLQYTLVGAALCLFYLALLSLSEVLSFGWAYALGAAAATGLVAAYSAFVLRGARRAWLMAGGLAIIYGFLYVLLRQQEYSLLYGTAGLFLLLALIMYATRHVDWYARDEQ
ncbi:MAG: cell envelope integrity protein CreD [Verrucomicrobiales bacterium]|nr:cell envelope integrity protein CreD [Verrucomicrobiales bacterium]